EGLHLRFQTDIFNVFNHPNFAPPVGIMSDKYFGLSRGMENIALSGSGGDKSPLHKRGGPAFLIAVETIFFLLIRRRGACYHFPPSENFPFPAKNRSVCRPR